MKIRIKTKFGTIRAIIDNYGVEFNQGNRRVYYGGWTLDAALRDFLRGPGVNAFAEEV